MNALIIRAVDKENVSMRYSIILLPWKHLTETVARINIIPANSLYYETVKYTYFLLRLVNKKEAQLL